MTHARRIALVLLLAALAACDQHQALPTSPVPDVGAEMQVVTAAAPAAPSGAAAAAVTSESIFLAWMDNSNDELRFEVARRVYAGGVWDAWQPYVDRLANTVNYLDPGVTGGNTYAYRVRACRGTECSAWAVSATVVAPKLVAPNILYVTAQSRSSARVGWADASFGESRFDLEKRQFIEGAWGEWTTIETSPNTTRYDVGGLTLGGTYEFRVRACYLNECSNHGTSAPFTLAAPAAPQDLGWVLIGSTSISLVWTDVSTDEVRFKLSRATRGADGKWGPFQFVATIPKNQTSYSDSGLTGGTPYKYQIQACNLADCSPPEASDIISTL